MLASGVITVVQEQRFQLQGEDGTCRHFTLAHDAPLGGLELQRLLRDGSRVAVRHGDPKPGHTTAPAHGVYHLRTGEHLPHQGEGP
jgi:hypothetical protein